MRNLWFVVFLTVVISVGGCAKKETKIDEGQSQKQQQGPVLAKVGDEVITLAEFNKSIENLPDNLKSLAEKNKLAYLENVIYELLLYKEGLRRHLDRDNEVQDIIQEAKKKIIITRLARDEIENKINISDEELKEYYNSHKDEFTTTKRYRASHILVKTLEEAADIVDRLNAGALFEELARKYSIDVTSKRGGDVGYFTMGEMVPEFEDTCVRLKIGEISGPVKTQFGYHIIKLTDIKEPSLVEFGKVKDKIKNYLKSKKRQALLDNLLTRLKSETEITINEELLKKEKDEETAVGTGQEGG